MNSNEYTLNECALDVAAKILSTIKSVITVKGQTNKQTERMNKWIYKKKRNNIARHIIWKSF